jgi:hypothetical protein
MFQRIPPAPVATGTDIAWRAAAPLTDRGSRVLISAVRHLAAQLSKGSAMPAGVGKRILSVHVIIDVMSKDGLRKFAFGLDKSTDKDDVEDWAIHFDLFERNSPSDEFDEAAIHVDVDVKAKNFDNMQITADKGFNTAQAQSTLVDVATAADRVKAGKTTPARLAKAVEGVIEARDA